MNRHPFLKAVAAVVTFCSGALPVAGHGAPFGASLTEQAGESASNTKADAIAAINRLREDLIGLADKVWSHAETALRETQSARVLADYIERQGFELERGVAGLPTAFVARFGEGRPIIGLLGEYDALPGLSQKARPVKEPLTPGAPGHGCGHNLLGAATLGAAVAIKEQIAAGRLKGTVRYYGCPAEETLVGKLYMARAGLFDDLDVALAWHPGDQTASDTDGTRAQVDFRVEFRGRAAHAASNPWAGRSALDALELFTHALNLMREHVKPSVRMHYVVTKGGDVPNIVPEYAQLWCWVRDSRRAGVEEVLTRLRKVSEGSGLMAEVESKLTVQCGVPEMLVNEAGARLVQANLERLGPIAFTAGEQQFARDVQRACGIEPKGLDGSIQPLRPQPPDPAKGSTDAAAVSWLVPTLNLRATTLPAGVPGHAWPVAACSRTSMGHRGMIHAAKALVATAVDLFEDAQAREAIQAEFRRKTEQSHRYRPLVPEGPPAL
jgi:aminobenzoyl-glutamate utilization protein B